MAADCDRSSQILDVYFVPVDMPFQVFDGQRCLLISYSLSCVFSYTFGFEFIGECTSCMSYGFSDS